MTCLSLSSACIDRCLFPISEICNNSTAVLSGINNTVTISENANPETTALYGGLSSSGNKLTDPLNVNNTTGNGFTAKNVANIETVNETISKVPANETVLELTLTISNASIRFCIHATRGGHHTGSIPDQGRIG